LLSSFLSRRPLLIAGLLAVTISAPALAIGLASGHSFLPKPLAQILDTSATASGDAPPAVVWEGRDIDGDGAPDIANPTGHAPRDHDAYGSGAFGASRDGGEREHLGVDYIASAGQAVMAPISGFVSKIGYAYPGDTMLKFVEIENPALHLQARVFYIDSSVAVGQAVRMGTPIGRAHTLQAKYPDGIIDHVHLEMADGRGRKLDAATLITAH
jgi:murein DD-endopeptidase MepM/ murein hydrolase activator NlpD